MALWLIPYGAEVAPTFSLVWNALGTAAWAADGDPAKALRKGELRFTLAGEKLQGCWCACAMTASTASATIGC
jgi:hypothetical protein